MTAFREVSTPVRVVGFIAALAAVFGITLGAGRLFGPVDAQPASAGHDTHASTEPTGPGDAMGSEHSDHLPGGLQVSQDGYTLRLHHSDLAAGSKTPLDFVVDGPDGKPVTAYTPQHEKELHLIAVRRDFSGFQHVHPTRAADGTWSTTLALTPGAWRVFADIAPKGAEPLTLGADVSVAGAHAPVAAPAEDVRVATVDGYTVTLKGDLAPGADSALTLSVSRGGQPVTDLDPYLGAFGHLVALRTGDLAYLHVHPEGHPGDGTTKPGPDITFGTTVPSAGTYRLFLDFQHEGVVRTAAFTVTAGGTNGHQH
ncbi:hypothetical protein JNB_12029 [Janibacter sp. HTCC2649]|uniref:hypothetical protein n=1 Tax=Janibacter sp. HTCC2649 TaxID=313589 RepID=UPI0000670B2D|nr:hypothetical protein [Janibacter sp. HTCC2649]EAQ00903.1 hypothetical protein JNB_12029 [Janibacter sp. HTCC2649]